MNTTKKTMMHLGQARSIRCLSSSSSAVDDVLYEHQPQHRDRYGSPITVKMTTTSLSDDILCGVPKFLDLNDPSSSPYAAYVQKFLTAPPGRRRHSSHVDGRHNKASRHTKATRRSSAAPTADRVSADQAVAIRSTPSSTHSSLHDSDATLETVAPLHPHGIDESYRSQTRDSDEGCSEEEEGGDTYDVQAMNAPQTDRHPQHHFHRLAERATLPDYTLGQKGRSRDMHAESSHKSARLAVAALLRGYDAAFLKRSCGGWTYAILAEKIIDDENIEESKLRFVVDKKGSTKNLSYRKWGECVRLVREPVEAAGEKKEGPKGLPEVMPF